MTFAGIVANVMSIGNTVITVLFSLAIIFFMVNIVRFFFIEGGEEGQTKGRKALIYGAIGLVVLFSAWGIIGILLNTLNSFAGAGTTATTSAQTTGQ
jgi:heme/copper-type cytochrome/quinol oxidase subunit 4